MMSLNDELFPMRDEPEPTARQTGDPTVRLLRKSTGSEAKLCYLGHGLMDKTSMG